MYGIVLSLVLSPKKHCWWLVFSQMLPHLLQLLSPAFQPLLHPAHHIPAHLTVGSILLKDAVSDTIKAFTQQKISYDYMHPLMNISSVFLVLISFKTDGQFAYQESYSWVPYCFAVLTASCSGGKLFFLSNLCSCWFIQSLLYLDSWACSEGWLSHKEEGASLLCLKLLFLWGEKIIFSLWVSAAWAGTEGAATSEDDRLQGKAS